MHIKVYFWYKSCLLSKMWNPAGSAQDKLRNSNPTRLEVRMDKKVGTIGRCQLANIREFHGSEMTTYNSYKFESLDLGIVRMPLLVQNQLECRLQI